MFQTITNQLESEIESWEDDYEKITNYCYPIHPNYAQIQYKITIDKMTYIIYIQSSINNISYNVWIICENTKDHKKETKLIWTKYDIK